MDSEKIYGFQSMGNCEPLDKETRRAFEESFRRKTLPKLEEIQRAKDLGAQKAAQILLR